MSRPDDAGVPAAEPVHLGPSTADLVVMFLLAGPVGLGAGLSLPWVARQAEGLPWVPFQGPLELVASLPWGWTTVGGGVAGLAMGVALAVVATRDALHVSVDPEAVCFTRRGVLRRITRADVSAVFLDGKRLVVVDRASHEVVGDEVDAGPEQIERAFRAHDYPWREQDPYADAFRPWVPETPDLPRGVQAVLAAREKSLQEKDAEDADGLRAELLRQGYVVRDRQARQYWRALQ